MCTERNERGTVDVWTVCQIVLRRVLPWHDQLHWLQGLGVWCRHGQLPVGTVPCRGTVLFPSRYEWTGRTECRCSWARYILTSLPTERNRTGLDDAPTHPRWTAQACARNRRECVHCHHASSRDQDRTVRLVSGRRRSRRSPARARCRADPYPVLTQETWWRTEGKHRVLPVWHYTQPDPRRRNVPRFCRVRCQSHERHDRDRCSYPTQRRWIWRRHIKLRTKSDLRNDRFDR